MLERKNFELEMGNVMYDSTDHSPRGGSSCRILGFMIDVITGKFRAITAASQRIL